ncbi:MBL fold metallo-hydrolase [Candidatus Curtissbacteria bacterium]|nr:MBL fold metallo-hydrolase [Candidatus Curtissbacteria bacterium]
MTITFYGACREVTGSHFLLETNNKKILLDCGIWQGYKLAEERNYAPFAFDPKSIDFVVIGHAHLDHTGKLPKLVKDGFRGKIFATRPTIDLTRLVLEDSEKLMREEAERENHPPLYTNADIQKTMVLFESFEYNQVSEISPQIKLTFKNAGHILGSAVTIIEAGGKRLAYTSDLGNTPSILLDPPATVDWADFAICESTYGGRIHEDVSHRQSILAQIISRTISQNGVLIIPSFAIERTQELLHDIDHFCEIDKCEKPTFFLDSPLAQKVTAVFGKYPKFLGSKIRKEHLDYDFFGLGRLKITATVAQSKAIRDNPNPKVIIAGSGMMNGGRILYHAIDFLGDPKNTLLIVGYQSKGTLGRRIIDGERSVKIMGKIINVCAQVVAIGSYSAHADSPQLTGWLAAINELKKVFFVHGEADQGLALANNIKSQLKKEAILPQTGESYDL